MQTEKQIQGLLLILPLGTQTFCLFVVDSVITAGTQLILDIWFQSPVYIHEETTEILIDDL